MPGKTYWVGDDRDNKSVCIKRELYVKGDEIPASDVEQELLDEWKEKGLIAVGNEAAPVVIIDTEAVKNLKTEIVSLTRDVDRIPGLEREVKDLKAAAEKAKTGAKAKVVKDLKADAKVKDDRIAELELDNQEKAALIDKLNADLDEATAPDKDASKDASKDGPGSSDDTETDDSAGPGGA